MMSEQDRVKKAIADKDLPEITRASMEDLQRYGDFHRDIDGILGRSRSPLASSPRFSVPTPWDEFPLVNESIFDTHSAIMRDFERTREEMRMSMSMYSGFASYMWDAGAQLFGDNPSVNFRPNGLASETATAVLEPPPEIPRPSKDILQRAAIPVTIVTDMRAELAVEAETLLGYSVLRKRLGMRSPLTEALLKLEIEPFDPKTVNTYKSEMLTYAQNEAARMDVAAGIRPGTWQARVARWQSDSIRDYKKPIPEFAIDTAVRLKKACPAVKFEIEELTIVPDPFLIAVLGRQRRYIEVWDEPKFEGR